MLRAVHAQLVGTLGADGYIDGIAKQVLALPTVPPSDNDEIGGTA